MSSRTYVRTYRAEVTETFSMGESDLTDAERALLDEFDAGAGSLAGDADEILCRFDADHEEIVSLDDRGLSIVRTD